MPVSAEAALTAKKFKHPYSGTWENTHDTNPSYIGGTGIIYIDIQKAKQATSKKTGKKIIKIKKAYVIYDDNTALKANGKIFRKNGKNRIRLNYPKEPEVFVGYIKGTITKKKIKGKFEHTYGNETWGGKIKLKKTTTSG